MKANRAPASPGKFASLTEESPGGDSNSHASGARASEARASTSSATRRVEKWSVRESNPPLQLEGLISCADRRTDLHREENRQWVVKELNPPPAASQLDGNGFTGRREEHHPRRLSESGLPVAYRAGVPGAGIEPAASAFRARRHYHQQLPRSSGRRIRTPTA